MKKNLVGSLERGLAILECFDLDTGELSLTEIRERIHLPASTTLRLINSLTDMGFLNRSRSKMYSLGNRAFLFGIAAQKHFKLADLVTQPMTDLRDVTKEAVALYAMEREHRVCYAYVEGLLSMRSIIRVGDRLPLWAGASGKCLLAWADQAIVERELEKIRPITPATILDKDLFLLELSQIRDAEVALSYGEREQGIISLAVPVFTGRYTVGYALSLSVPATRVTDDNLSTLIQETKETARGVSRLLYNN